MAAAYAALVSLMNTVEQIQNHPQLSTSLDHFQIEILREKVYFFLDFIESYSSHVDDLERWIATAAHAAEDLFESHVVWRIRTHEKNSLDLQKVIVDMDLVREKVLKVKEERGVRYEQPTANSSRSVASNREAIMVGFGGYLDQLLDLLTGNQSSRQIISIVGMGGTDIFLEALSHLKELTGTIEMDNERDEYRLGEQLYKGLTGRRYLIVLDDVWSVEVWDKIRFYFPDNGNRSRLIFTTRLSDVAFYCGSCCVRVNLLDECECWDLFCVRVFGEEDCPLELEQIGREIAKMCRGLPLSITVIGGLLQKSAKTVEYWHNVLENIRAILSSGEGDQCLNVLYSSYSHLPAHLKPCFLYMGTFQEDREIPVSRITKLWVAEGFLKPKAARVLEEVAEDYLKDLIDRNLVLVGKYRKNGKVRSVCIHDLLRDLCISLADKEKFFSSARVWYRSEDSSVGYLSRKCKLRFFAYSPANFSEFNLTSSISFVWNLQTLIFQGRCGLVDAPAEIWEMS
ncbi:putative late blight resistance protein homolog R1A-10 isoform X2 [Salvia miltiorrhiza]|uniref:putative late blight resistance protein homolog R1A-10 isoform X2 n=1 Tax=Salvia miltiorrhiza TaxID=226208 RepID=UPI0025AC79FF|nr:putative late blight resistance protein homolog R1A-10 isoform X2 [Salvia miltiorrhiza]XP_057780843.1 putative late blight resistance protein homolog R1A-10 isoform X2 [Salvia miltiorrhiza]